MKTELIEMGKISSRGQVAIPSDIRTQMELKEGSKVLFFLEKDTLLMKKVTPDTFAGLKTDLYRRLREFEKNISKGKKYTRKDLRF